MSTVPVTMTPQGVPGQEGQQEQQLQTTPTSMQSITKVYQRRSTRGFSIPAQSQPVTLSVSKKVN